jgi:hypothetical protein
MFKFKKFFLLLFTLFLGLSSCTNNDNNQSTINVDTLIASTLIGKGSISNPNIPLQNTLISNQTQWIALLATMDSINNVSNNFTETNINFNLFDVVAVFRNPISNSTSTVDITSIVETQTNRVVTVQYLINGISADVAQTFHIVKIPKSIKPISFQ